MTKRLFFLILIAGILILAVNPANAQIGGSSTYRFLNLPNSPRVAALGGNFVAIADNDLAVGLNNPSMINKEMHNSISLNFVDYFADINYGFASYSRTFEKAGSFAATMQYLNYGKFTYADETGIVDENASEFSGNELALVIGWGRRLDSLFSIGANLKAISSTLETYNSFGMAVDVAGSYHARSGFTASLIARNIGAQLSTYTPGNSEPLPFEIQLGISKKLKHLPFRYSVLLTNLQKWDLTYDDPAESVVDPFTGEVQTDSDVAVFFDKAFRHVVIGGEFVPSRNFSFRLGYNYQRRQEMKVESKKGTVGFSWGFGFRVSKFNFNYARSAYHLAGSPNMLSIAFNLSDFASSGK
ncbi:MAG: type IX secretion system protein PorQ [Lentimicrobium sp.]|nr:type IX secretion system protein PorQ [Lentimicrobium sp.]